MPGLKIRQEETAAPANRLCIVMGSRSRQHLPGLSVLLKISGLAPLVYAPLSPLGFIGL